MIEIISCVLLLMFMFVFGMLVGVILGSVTEGKAIRQKHNLPSAREEWIMKQYNEMIDRNKDKR